MNFFRSFPAAASALALAVFALGASPALADIKFGLQVPLTGAAATDGKSAQIAAQLAVDSINASGGVLGQKVVLVTYDDQAKAEQAIFTAHKLVDDDKVKFVIQGSYSDAGRAAAPVFQAGDVLMISAYGVHPDITKAGYDIFRTIHLGPPQGRAGAQFVGTNLKLKKVDAITIDNDYGQATMDGFKAAAPKYGITIAGNYSYSITDRQFGSIVASVKRDNPDGVYITGYFFTAGPLVSQLRAAGITVPIVGSQAFDSQKFIDIAGAASNGVYILDGLNRDRNDARFTSFSAAFMQKAGYPIENVGTTTYSATQLLADAIKKAKSTDVAKVRLALVTMKNFPALQGTINVLSDREVQIPFNVNVVRDGKFVHFATLPDGAATSGF